MKLKAHHVDITDDLEPVMEVTASERLMLQIEMIEDHKWLWHFRTTDEAAMHWVEVGLAGQFAKHYKLKP